MYESGYSCVSKSVRTVSDCPVREDISGQLFCYLRDNEYQANSPHADALADSSEHLQLTHHMEDVVLRAWDSLIASLMVGLSTKHDYNPTFAG